MEQVRLVEPRRDPPEPGWPLAFTLGFAVVLAGLFLGLRRGCAMDGSPTPKDTPRVAREAIRRVFNRNIDELPQLIRVKIQVAALNAQRKGRAAMEVAACAEYRYWHARAGYEG